MFNNLRFLNTKKKYVNITRNLQIYFRNICIFQKKAVPLSSETAVNDFVTPVTRIIAALPPLPKN